MNNAEKAVFTAVVLVILFGMMLLAGCAGKAAKPEERIVVSTVIKPCVTSATPPPPARYADADLAQTQDPVVQVNEIATANQQRKARLAEVEPVIAACR